MDQVPDSRSCIHIPIRNGVLVSVNVSNVDVDKYTVYIKLSDAKWANNYVIEKEGWTVIVDYDIDGNVIGYEVLR